VLVKVAVQFVDGFQRTITRSTPRAEGPPATTQSENHLDIARSVEAIIFETSGATAPAPSWLPSRRAVFNGEAHTDLAVSGVRKSSPANQAALLFTFQQPDEAPLVPIVSVISLIKRSATSCRSSVAVRVWLARLNKVRSRLPCRSTCSASLRSVMSRALITTDSPWDQPTGYWTDLQKTRHEPVPVLNAHFAEADAIRASACPLQTPLEYPAASSGEQDKTILSHHLFRRVSERPPGRGADVKNYTRLIQNQDDVRRVSKECAKIPFAA